MTDNDLLHAARLVLGAYYEDRDNLALKMLDLGNAVHDAIEEGMCLPPMPSDDLTAVRTTIGLVVENIDALIDCMKDENARLLALLDTHPWAEGFEKAGYGFSPITTSDMCCGCGNYDVCDGIQTAMTICPEYLKEKPKEGMADLRGTVEPMGVTYTREDVQDWVTHAEMRDYVEKAIARALYPCRAPQDDGDAE